MEFNKEVFETEEDYCFKVSTCVVHKIIKDNQPCSCEEIVLIAKNMLPSEMFGFVENEIEDVLKISAMQNMIKFKHGVYAITLLGIDELNLAIKDINIEHSITILNIKNLN